MRRPNNLGLYTQQSRTNSLGYFPFNQTWKSSRILKLTILGIMGENSQEAVTAFNRTVKSIPKINCQNMICFGVKVKYQGSASIPKKKPEVPSAQENNFEGVDQGKRFCSSCNSLVLRLPFLAKCQGANRIKLYFHFWRPTRIGCG